MRVLFTYGKWILIAVFTLLLPVEGVLAAEHGGGQDIVHIQILTVNDFHGALAEDGKNTGAAKLVQFLNDAKVQDSAETILVSAGDMFQGTPDSNLLYGKTVVDIMNYAHFDAMTLGNHEFDWGVDIVKQRIAQSTFPYVCANVIDRQTGKTIDFVKPYIIIERNGVKIGIIGIATQETAVKTNPKMISNYIFFDPVKVVNTLVPEVKQQGADIIVLVTHLASFMDASGQITGDAAKLALETKEIDAIVSGHSHKIVYGKVNEIPIVQAAYNGRAVGKIELAYNKSTHKVENSTIGVTLLPYPGMKADVTVEGILNRTQKEIEPVKSIVLGQTKRTLTHDRNELKETQLGQWVTDTMRQAVHADIAFQNTGGLRKGIAAGVITMGTLYEVMPFDNTLYTLDMTGQQILKVLEYGLMNDQVGMLQYSGLKVEYNPAELPGRRITAVTLSGGKPLQLNHMYKVVTNDFMAAGGDGFTLLRDGKNLHDTCIPIREVLADAIRSQKAIDFIEDSRFEIKEASQIKRNTAA